MSGTVSGTRMGGTYHNGKPGQGGKGKEGGGGECIKGEKEGGGGEAQVYVCGGTSHNHNSFF